MSDFALKGGRLARHGCYAHFPGSGPDCETCMGCRHFAPDKDERYQRAGQQPPGVCNKWRALMKREPGLIEALTPACKYFERRGA